MITSFKGTQVFKDQATNTDSYFNIDILLDIWRRFTNSIIPICNRSGGGTNKSHEP